MKRVEKSLTNVQSVERIAWWRLLGPVYSGLEVQGACVSKKTKKSIVFIQKAITAEAGAGAEAEAGTGTGAEASIRFDDAF
jgi:hypothetical protein